MVYSGTMHCILAIIACITVPRSVVILQHTWQVVTLLLTGKPLLPAYALRTCNGCMHYTAQGRCHPSAHLASHHSSSHRWVTVTSVIHGYQRHAVLPNVICNSAHKQCHGPTYVAWRHSSSNRLDVITNIMHCEHAILGGENASLIVDYTTHTLLMAVMPAPAAKSK